jgi:putative membrane protein
MKMMKMALVAAAAVGMCGLVHAQAPSSADKTFIEDSSQGSLFEVNVAKLALEKSKDPNVRKFAERMITDHEKLIEQMKPIAMQYHVKTPTGPSIADRAKYEELKLKSGTDFDRAYVEAMVKDHNEDLQKFIAEENSTQVPELKATVAKGEKVIREHTQMIDDIAHMGGIQTPPMPAGA